MARKQSARRAPRSPACAAGEARADRLSRGRERGSAPRHCLSPAGRTDGLWLAAAPFTFGAGSADMTGMASGWRGGPALGQHRGAPVRSVTARRGLTAAALVP